MDLKENMKIIPALGRPGVNMLGRLYDCTKETVVTGDKIWSDIKEKLTIKQKGSVQVAGYEEMYNHLGVDKDSRLHRNLGLIDPKGATGYLLTCKETNKYKAGQFLVHQYESIEEHLEVESMKPLETDQISCLQAGTHVITGITFGCNSIFWTRNQLNDMNQGDKSLNDLIQKAKVADLCNGELFSDLSIGERNGNLLDALHHMKNIEEVLQENPDFAAKPIKFHLYPTQSLLGDEAKRTYRDITPTLSPKVLTMFDGMKNVEVILERLQEWPYLKEVNTLSETMCCFEEFYNKNKQDSMGYLQRLLTDVHDMKKDEQEIKAFLQTEEESWLAEKQVVGWMKRKEKDYEKIEEIRQKFENIPLLFSQRELTTNLLLKKECAVFCLVLQVPEKDLFLDRLKQPLAEKNDDKEIDYNWPKDLIDNLNKKVEIFEEEWKDKRDDPIVAFFVAIEKAPVQALEAVINLYQNGLLEFQDFAPLCSPENLFVMDVTSTTAKLQWNAEEQPGEEYKYIVSVKEQGKDGRTYTTTNRFIEIDDLDPETEYEISVAQLLRTLQSEDSECVMVQTQRPDVTSQPQKPICFELTPRKVRLQWEEPERVSQRIRSYIICDEDGNVMDQVDGNTKYYDINLVPNKKYQFTVQADCGEHGWSKQSELSDPYEQVMTEDELRKERILEMSYLLSKKNEKPQIYLLQLEEKKYDHGKVRRCEFGTPATGVKEKVVMLLGATGSGKTTLINGFVNYIVGGKWTDDYRIKLIPEDERTVSQSQSQTTMITAYTIHHQPGFRVPYTITLVDTPGFGDTSGIQKDREITASIDKFFREEKRLDHINVVGFVAQSSLARLTPTQRYIFDSILSLFGKDVAGNINPLLTFADGHAPQVLCALKDADIPCNEYFKFNSSALYADREGPSAAYDKMFWEMGEKSFQDFADCVSHTMPISLFLTKQVLAERETLELQIEGINQDVMSGLNKLEQLEREYQVVQHHEEAIASNKDFTYRVMEEKQFLVAIPEGKCTTNCIVCKITCHYPCRGKLDAHKKTCSAMKNGICIKCKCSWTEHKNLPHRYDIERVEVIKTYDQLKSRYEIAKGGKQTHEKILLGIRQEFDERRMEIAKKTMEIRRCITRLREIALKPNPLSTVEYVQILIDAEKGEAKPGWHERCEQLKKVKKTAQFLEQLADDGFNPFENQQEILERVRAHHVDEEMKSEKKKKGFKKALKTMTDFISI